MIGMKKIKVWLDPKESFDAWIESGSVYKARYIMRDKYGKVNPSSGKIASHEGIWDAAWRYVLDNPIEARKQINDVWKANGELLDDTRWNTMVIRRARYLYSDKRYSAYLAKHSYLTPYQNV